MLGGVDVNYMASYAGTRSTSTDANSSAFTYSGLNYRYDGTQPQLPDVLLPLERRPGRPRTRRPTTSSRRRRSAPARRKGDEVGGQVDALKHYTLGSDAAQLKFGAKYRDESRDNVNLNRNFTAASPFPLTQVLGNFSDPNFYQDLAKGFEIGPQANHGCSRHSIATESRRCSRRRRSRSATR